MSRNPFSILRNTESTPPGPAESNPAAAASARERVIDLVQSCDVFVFMKGSPQTPMCGFSANTIAIVSSYGVPFETFDVLSNPDIRTAVKEHGDWPTFPQVYAQGELVGGDDIISEMHTCGDLGSVLEGRSS